MIMLYQPIALTSPLPPFLSQNWERKGGPRGYVRAGGYCMAKPRRIRTSASVQLAAIDLRQNLTHAERLLWDRLHNRQLGGFKFHQQRPRGRSLQISIALKPGWWLRSTAVFIWQPQSMMKNGPGNSIHTDTG